MAEAQDRTMTERTGGRRSPDEIRAEIERTRSEMHETVDALGARLSAGQIFDEIWHRVRSGSGDGSSVMKEHPVPLALMGLGLGWLAVEKATGSGERHATHTHASHHDATGAAYGSPTSPPSAFLDRSAEERGTVDKVKEKAAGVGERVSSKAHEAQERVSDKAHEAKERVTGKAHEATERARLAAESARQRAGTAASSVRDSARTTMNRARTTFDRLNEEQPLALGAVAFGLGMAAGMAAPTSRWEDEHLGDASERVKDTARFAAEELKHSAEEIGSEAKIAAREAVQETKRTLEDTARETEGRSAGERVGAAIDRTTETVRRVADRHDLGSEGLRMRADEAKETAREGMREVKDTVRDSARDTGTSGEGRVR